MAETRSLLTSLIRHPVSFSILVLSVVILVVWFDYKSTQVTSNNSPAGQNSLVQGGVSSAPMTLAPPGSQPSIMKEIDSASNQGQGSAPAIDALVGRLEEKVKADPENVDNRILLAQTYKELGRAPDAVQELRVIQKQNPDLARVNLVLASILSQSADPEELQEALALLKKVENDAGVQPYLVHLYRGDAMIRQQDHQGALESWKQALAGMPTSDARYSALEKKVMDLTNGLSATTAPGS